MSKGPRACLERASTAHAWDNLTSKKNNGCNWIFKEGLNKNKNVLSLVIFRERGEKKNSFAIFWNNHCPKALLGKFVSKGKELNA